MGQVDRRKDPEGVRAALLAAAGGIIAQHGLARLTVDGVAAAAGVTKGGLFHHFPSKQALIEGVVDGMIADADTAIDRLMAADPEPHGRFTRAMLSRLADPAERACATVGDPGGRTLCVAMLADPTLTARWTRWYEARVARHEAEPCAACAVVRLAIDGLWLNSLHDPAGAMAPGVHDQLLALTRDGP